jgi:sec-independent protein translocase protein TatA
MSEILVIALLVLVLFGANKIPQFMRGLGQGVREFKSAANSVKSELEKEPETGSLPKGKE